VVPFCVCEPSPNALNRALRELRNVSELFGVCDDIDALNAIILHIECEDRMGFSVEVVDESGLPIDFRQVPHESFRDQTFHPTKDAADDIVYTTDQFRDCDPLSTAVGVKDNIVSQKIRQPTHVAGVDCGEKPFEQVVALILRCVKAGTPCADMLARPPQYLAAV
jgi:hypothetical protein